MRARIITDEMKMLVVRGCNTERLFHQAVGLVSVAVGSFFSVHIIATISATVWSFGRWCESATCSLALHLSVCQEASRNSTGAPTFAIGPPSHACLALVPHKD